MALKTVIDSDAFDALDEAAKPLYEEKDGKYILAIEDVDNHPGVANLRNALGRTKEARDDFRKKIEALEGRLGKLLEHEDLDLADADEETIERVLALLGGEDPGNDPDDGKGGKKPGGNVDLEKVKASARRAAERERDDWKARAEKAEGQLDTLVKDNALTEALVAAKVMGPYMAPLKSHFAKMIKIVEGDDGAPTAMIEGEYGEQTVANYVKEWSQTDDGKAFVDGGGNSGGGANGGGSGGGAKVKNPWDPKTRNVTEQMALFKKDPEKARRMAAEHGVTL